MELPTTYLLTNHIYNHLTVYKQMTDVELNCSYEIAILETN